MKGLTLVQLWLHNKYSLPKEPLNVNHTSVFRNFFKVLSFWRLRESMRICVPHSKTELRDNLWKIKPSMLTMFAFRLRRIQQQQE